MEFLGRPLAVVGLGYVGLPLGLAFAAHHPVIGFDKNGERVAALKAGHDITGEVNAKTLGTSTITLTDDPAMLDGAEIFIITVPTPVDAAKRPDLSHLEAASRTVGAALKKGGVVIYESTVYPGCTRNVCVPVLEAASGLRCDEDFVVGYSPERVNPGDPVHRLDTIVKVTSGSTPEAAEAIDALYAQIVTAGTHKAPSIEVAEAAKVIENTQRDLNIALMNELSTLFHTLGLDTLEVLEAARTKWNFLNFRPGLVGGHCVGVDPYYLTDCAQRAGHHPELILAGRRINDEMGAHVVSRVTRRMMGNGLPVVGSAILVMGVAFKEDCPDIRNSRVPEVVRGLVALNATVDVWDPVASPAEVFDETGLSLLTEAPPEGAYDAVVIAVAHGAFRDMGPAVRKLLRTDGVLFDVKGLFDRALTDGRL